MRLNFDYEFAGSVDEIDFGRMVYSVIWLPKDIQVRLPFEKYPRLRINAEIGGLFINCAFQIQEKRRYLILSKDLLKQTGIERFQVTKVRFSIADQTAVEIPYELELALSNNPEAQRRWDKLSAGKKRGYTHRVGSAKKEETIIRRVEAVIDDLLTS
ncbi:MAG: hypothetical protein SynsKO_08740 [Synoicihabitans sp.]